jgi:hypothetical protein
VQELFLCPVHFFLNRLKLERVDKKTKELFREIMREIGRKGGKIGGKRSLETMTAAERTARAKKAAAAAAHKRTAERLVRERAARRK